MPETKIDIMTFDEPKLLAILKDPGAKEFDKAKACQRLAVAGTKDAVPVLAAMLSDPKFSHYARFGLQAIPDPAVDQALRAALAKVKGELLVGVINSIGCRKDTTAVPALVKLVNDRDGDVAAAAVSALGRIGGPEAVKTITKSLHAKKGPLLEAAADAGLVCAEGLAAQGKRKEASDLYQILRGPRIPKPARTAAEGVRS